MKILSFFLAIIFSAQVSAGSLQESLEACEHLCDAQARHFALLKNEVLNPQSSLKPVLDSLYQETCKQSNMESLTRANWNKIQANAYQMYQSYWELFKEATSGLRIINVTHDVKYIVNKICMETIFAAVTCLSDMYTMAEIAALLHPSIKKNKILNGNYGFVCHSPDEKALNIFAIIGCVGQKQREFYNNNDINMLFSSFEDENFEGALSYAGGHFKNYFDEYQAWRQIYQWLSPYAGLVKTNINGSVRLGETDNALDYYYSKFNNKTASIWAHPKVCNRHFCTLLNDKEIEALKSKWLGKLLGDLYQSDLINRNIPDEKELTHESSVKPKKSKKKKKKSKKATDAVTLESKINSEGEVAQEPAETKLPAPEKIEPQEPIVPEGKREEAKMPSISPIDPISDDNSNTVETQAPSQNASGEDEEEFDLLAYVNFWKNNSKAVSKNQPASKEGKGEQQKPKIRLDDDARKVIEASFHYGDSIIKRRDFISCVQQLGGKLLKGRGNGTSYYSLPNYEGEKTSRPFMLFRIHLPHTGSEDLRRGDLTAFFKRALETVGITKEMIE